MKFMVLSRFHLMLRCGISLFITQKFKVTIWIQRTERICPEARYEGKLINFKLHLTQDMAL